MPKGTAYKKRKTVRPKKRKTTKVKSRARRKGGVERGNMIVSSALE